MKLELGPLANAEMLTGPLPRRRELLERVAACGVEIDAVAEFNDRLGKGLAPA